MTSPETRRLDLCNGPAEIAELARRVGDLARRVDGTLFASIAGLSVIVATLISQLPG
jgi:hypothetical protein